ncbi:MAG: antifreeze protein [Candidatus Cloacimonetes bacterium 4572_55]|nr:MAG: antifreeze protein [Candidatus Cloacimonetes bacterium 4572_55]
MGLWNRLSNEFVDIIEWVDNSRDIMVYRYPRYDNEIKYGAKLIVRESQSAVFIEEGQLADVFTPGTYTLDTKNLPVLGKLKGWKYGFESPFKSEIYFVSMRVFTDRKWGTKQPIMLRDPEFGAVRLRAFGTYTVRVSEPDIFLQEITGTDERFTTDKITDQLRNMIISRFTDLLGEQKIPALDLAANYTEMGDFITSKLHPEFEAYGLDISKILIESISLPDAVEKALDKRTSMGIIGDMSKYTQFQTANAIEEAAKNPGSGGDMASGGMGMGLGFAMANQIGKSMGAQQSPAPQQAPAPAPPPLPSMLYYAALGGKQAGPFDAKSISGMIRSGQMDRGTLVWKQGMATWTKAGDVEELQSVFGAIPPPLPPR